jgi:hypothetical protein
VKDVREKELQTHLDAILTLAQSERIVISRGGKPCAVLVGIENYDAEDLSLARSEEFWRMIRARRTSGPELPLAEVEKRLGVTGNSPTGKAGANRRARKHS